MISQFNIRMLEKKHHTKEIELCGIHPVLTLMKTLREDGAKNSKCLAYSNSGDSTGDRTSVVGYGACLFY